jgi:hypothetical protein
LELKWSDNRFENAPGGGWDDEPNSMTQPISEKKK